MNSTLLVRLASLPHQNRFPKRTIAALTLAVCLLGALAGCGKSTKATAPVTNSSDDPTTESEAKEMAQQSVVMGNTYLEQAKSLINVATIRGAKPTRLHPYKAQGSADDSTSLDYALQGYDVDGHPIDWATQSDELASLGMDYRWYYRTSGDSLRLEYDVRSHGIVAGLEAAATRYVANARDSMFIAYDGYSVGYHWIWDYEARSEVSSLTWEKSGTLTYPVAGTITYHWAGTYEYWYSGQHSTGRMDTDVTITFNGTRYASVRTGAYTFTLDLETGIVT